MLLADMPIAVERILAAIGRKERIAIHGDYDVDGVTSTVILRRALELLGADVVHFIPERLKDGYGLQPAALERLHADGVALVISVDCGIRGAEAARRARELGLDLIITDHHEPDTELPAALAVINPKRHDCTYPDKSGGRRCGAEAGAGALSTLWTRQLAARIHQGRRNWNVGRRRSAGR
jgi:single-stranded-DNA-specific exonuclease